MTTPAPEETIDDLAEARPRPGTVIDVRGPEEFAAGHVPGALNVPLEDVLASPDRSYTDDGDTVHVICQSGRRSLKAAEAMNAAGVPAISVAGGTTAWIESGRSVEA